jgi:nitric oxide reductase activation protein
MGMWVAGGGLMLALGSAGQGIGYPGADTPAGPAGGLIVAPDAKTAKMEKDQREQMNADRQKKLVADTAKLLELANELKTAVDKSNKDTLSLDVVRKADAIEKLAHSVKEGMKGN